MAKSKEKLVPVEGGVIPERDAGTPPVLEARHLGIDFGGLTAVDDFNFIIGKTEIGGLIGPNGAGKTTIFNLLTNVYQPTRGKILIGGVDTRGKKTYEVNRMGIARTFQNIRLFKALPVLDNVLIGMQGQMHYRLAEAGAAAAQLLEAGESGKGKGNGAALDLWDGIPRRCSCREFAIRRAAAARDRSGAGDESQSAAAG